MSIIFGPVNSRRFGKSLGIDLSPHKKQCNFDCLYCELAPAKVMDSYSDVIAVDEIVIALQEALKKHNDIDIITITANGEPTLYPHLDTLIDRLNAIKNGKKLLILSNGSTISDKAIQKALCKLDVIKLSLDCVTKECLKKLDRASKSLDVEDIKRGMLEFRSSCDKPLIIEVLFVKNINHSDEHIAKLSEFLLKLNPARVDIGTIDRPPAYDVKELSFDELLRVSKMLDSTLPIYIASRKNTHPREESYDADEILATLANRPLSDDDIAVLFDDESKKRLKDLLEAKKIKKTEKEGIVFYIIS